MLEVRLWSSPHENSGRGRQYSTGSVSDLNLGKHPSIEAQVAHAPRTVPAPSQIMMAGPFSFAVANQGSWITLLQLLRGEASRWRAPPGHGHAPGPGWPLRNAHCCHRYL